MGEWNPDSSWSLYVDGNQNSNNRFQEALLLSERPEMPTSKTEKSDFEIGHIKFENYFAVYPGQKHPSLKNLNFEIANGSLLGVIGSVLNSQFSLLNKLPVL